jgi:hypothetical protein
MKVYLSLFTMMFGVGGAAIPSPIKKSGCGG